MSDNEDEIMDTEKSNKFLASMSSLEGGRKRFLHGTDESQVLDKPLSELTGSELTVKSLLFDFKVGDGGESTSKKKKKRKEKLKEKEEKKLEGDLEKIYNKTVEKSKEKLSLSAPLSTPQAQKASRSATYKKVSQEVKQWDSVIHSRRAAPVVTYPLEKPDMKLKSVAQHNNTNFTPRTPLEAAVMEALHGGQKQSEDPNQKIKAGLTFKEQWQQMQELSRLKAHMRYQEAKISRQNKIKSKSYRRHLRRQKAKEKEKELAELQKTNPELVEDQLEESETLRTEERATLKHSKANRNKKLQFKTQADKKSGENKQANSSAKAILDSMAQKRRELLSKKTADDDDEEVATTDDEMVLNGDEKPFVFNADVLLSEERNPWMTSNNNEEALKEKMAVVLKGLEEKSGKDKKKSDVNPNDFAMIQGKRVLNVGNEDSDDEDDGDSGDDERRQQIGEIFAEDDLIAEEFEREKNDLRSKKKKQKIEVAMPGWGTWSGQEKKQQKRRRPIDKIKLGVKIPDQTKPVAKPDMCTAQDHVIIADDKSSLRDKQLNTVPFPYTSVADYEASLRQPLGDTFIPRTSHKKAIRPKQKIPLGAVIEPMDKQVLIKRGILPSGSLDLNE